MIRSNKTSRFFQSFDGIENGRKGKCNPKNCKTQDRKRGSACCKIGYICPFLKKDLKCKIYKIRPINCKVYPRTKKDLKLVKRCGYYWLK